MTTQLKETIRKPFNRAVIERCYWNGDQKVGMITKTETQNTSMPLLVARTLSTPNTPASKTRSPQLNLQSNPPDDRPG